jgi:(p)ppGpp synthase/HD superfamily hydrolase
MSDKIIASDTMSSFRFESALAYAARFHAVQRRKGTRIPYISYPLAVASIVLEYGGKEDEAIAALLHDVIEDGGGKRAREEIRLLFGSNVVAIVDGCSDTDKTPKPPWKERKIAYIAHLPQESKSVLLVSAADKLHNSRAILADYRVLGEKLWERFKGGRDSLWYYRELVKAFKTTRKHPRLIEELNRMVFELEELASV